MDFGQDNSLEFPIWVSLEYIIYKDKPIGNCTIPWGFFSFQELQLLAIQEVTLSLGKWDLQINFGHYHIWSSLLGD